MATRYSDTLRSGQMAVFTIKLEKVACKDEQALIQGLEHNFGVTRVGVNLIEGLLTIQYNPRLLSASDLQAALKRPDLLVVETVVQRARRFFDQHGIVIRLYVAISFLALSLFLSWRLGADLFRFPDPLFMAVNGIVIVLSYSTFVRSFKALAFEHRVTADALVIGIAISALLAGLWQQAALVVFIAILGEALENAILRNTRHMLSSDSIMGSRMVTVRRGDQTEEMPANRIKRGDILVIKQGMMIPADGVVTFGMAEICEAAITGESAFRIRDVGDYVFAGGLAQSGTFEMRAEKIGSQTSLASIQHLITRASLQRTQTQKLVDRIAHYFVITLLIVVVAVFVLYGQYAFWKSSMPAEEAMRRGLAILITLCPFAVILSTPLAMFAGILRMAGMGVVVKGGDVFERLRRVTALYMDKTGTLTYGRPAVAEVRSFGSHTANQVLEAALFVEQRSNHPMARAICQYCAAKGVTSEFPERFIEFEGGGAGAVKAGRHVKIGAFWLMEDGQTMPAELTEWMATVAGEGRTAVLVSDRHELIGGIVLDDELRANAAETIRTLKTMGIKRVVMLTGDNPEVAARLAARLPLDSYVAGCMPDNKIQEMNKEKRLGHGVAMVGDGINDAPALAAADVGIAMGVMGSDTAIEVSDVSLLRNEFTGLIEVFHISRRVVRTVYLSIALALMTNLAMVVLAAMGQIEDTNAAFLQMAIVVIVALNSMVLLTGRKMYAKPARA